MQTAIEKTTLATKPASEDDAKVTPLDCARYTVTDAQLKAINHRIYDEDAQATPHVEPSKEERGKLTRLAIRLFPLFLQLCTDRSDCGSGDAIESAESPDPSTDQFKFTKTPAGRWTGPAITHENQKAIFEIVRLESIKNQTKRATKRYRTAVPKLAEMFDGGGAVFDRQYEEMVDANFDDFAKALERGCTHLAPIQKLVDNEDGSQKLAVPLLIAISGETTAVIQIKDRACEMDLALVLIAACEYERDRVESGRAYSCLMAVLHLCGAEKWELMGKEAVCRFPAIENVHQLVLRMKLE